MAKKKTQVTKSDKARDCDCQNETTLHKNAGELRARVGSLQQRLAEVTQSTETDDGVGMDSITLGDFIRALRKMKVKVTFEPLGDE